LGQILFILFDSRMITEQAATSWRPMNEQRRSLPHVSFCCEHCLPQDGMLAAGLLAMKKLKTAAYSNVTLAPTARAGACGWNSGSIRTVPVNHSAGPLADG
jgi:hypothetical protein